MSWTFKVLKQSFPEGELYEVCEDFEGCGHTGGISPMGESLEELEWTLIQMLRAVGETMAGERQPIDETLEGKANE